MLQKKWKNHKKTKPDCLSVLENKTQQSFRFSGKKKHFQIITQPVFWAVLNS